MLPSLGISLGGQFFVFFQVYCLHTECVEKKRSPNLVKIYLGYIQESANKKLFPSMPDVLCLHQWLLRQSARRKSKVHKVKNIKNPKNNLFRFIMAEGSVYFGAVAGSYASGLCFANFGYQVWYYHWHWQPPGKLRKRISLSQTVFFTSCGLNSLGLLYSLFYMSNMKQEVANSSDCASEK